MKKDVENMMQPDRVAEAVTYLSEKKKQGEYTISDYYAIPEDVRAELIDGVIYDMAPPLSVHQLLSAKIHGYLARYIEKKGGSCIPFFAPIGVQLDKDDKTIVEPDILIVCDRNQITRRRIYGAPDFVIEILSESTKKKDSYLKLMKYQNAGVREYWLVDPEKKKVIVYDFEQEEIPKIYGFDTRVPVGIFGGECKVDFAEIYEEIRFIYEKEEK